MGIYQTCRLFDIESAGLITYCDTDTSQLRKIAFQKFPIYGSSVHIHQLFFASFKNADSGNERQYFVTVIHGAALQKFHQSIPDFVGTESIIALRTVTGSSIIPVDRKQVSGTLTAANVPGGAEFTMKLYKGIV